MENVYRAAAVAFKVGMVITLTFLAGMTGALYGTLIASPETVARGFECMQGAATLEIAIRC